MLNLRQTQAFYKTVAQIARNGPQVKLLEVNWESIIVEGANGKLKAFDIWSGEEVANVCEHCREYRIDLDADGLCQNCRDDEEVELHEYVVNVAFTYLETADYRISAANERDAKTRARQKAMDTFHDPELVETAVFMNHTPGAWESAIDLGIAWPD